jgi:hypothetical protein
MLYQLKIIKCVIMDGELKGLERKLKWSILKHASHYDNHIGDCGWFVCCSVTAYQLQSWLSDQWNERIWTGGDWI